MKKIFYGLTAFLVFTAIVSCQSKDYAQIAAEFTQGLGPKDKAILVMNDDEQNLHSVFYCNEDSSSVIFEYNMDTGETSTTAPIDTAAVRAIENLIMGKYSYYAGKENITAYIEASYCAFDTIPDPDCDWEKEMQKANDDKKKDQKAIEKAGIPCRYVMDNEYDTNVEVNNVVMQYSPKTKQWTNIGAWVTIEDENLRDSTITTTTPDGMYIMYDFDGKILRRVN